MGPKRRISSGNFDHPVRVASRCQQYYGTEIVTLIAGQHNVQYMRFSKQKIVSLKFLFNQLLAPKGYSMYLYMLKYAYFLLGIGLYLN